MTSPEFRSKGFLSHGLPSGVPCIRRRMSPISRKCRGASNLSIRTFSEHAPLPPSSMESVKSQSEVEESPACDKQQARMKITVFFISVINIITSLIIIKKYIREAVFTEGHHFPLSDSPGKRNSTIAGNTENSRDAAPLFHSAFIIRKAGEKKKNVPGRAFPSSKKS